MIQLVREHRSPQMSCISSRLMSESNVRGSLKADTADWTVSFLVRSRESFGSYGVDYRVLWYTAEDSVLLHHFTLRRFW